MLMKQGVVIVFLRRSRYAFLKIDSMSCCVFDIATFCFHIPHSRPPGVAYTIQHKHAMFNMSSLHGQEPCFFEKTSFTGFDEIYPVSFRLQVQHDTTRVRDFFGFPVAQMGLSPIN